MFKKSAVVLLTAATSVMVSVLPVSTAQASIYPCSAGFFRTYDYTNHVSAIGVTGQLQTPGSTLPGIASGPSAADLSVINYSTGEFLQYGWYEGAADGLPYSTVPRVFFGESTVTNASGEVLIPGPTLLPGSSHQFQILKTVTGGYHMYLDGAYALSNTFVKGPLPTPQMTGETNVLCTEMRAVAHRYPSPPNPTLYYASGTAGSPVWSLFIDTYLKSADAAATGGFASTSWNGQATFFGWGGG